MKGQPGKTGLFLVLYFALLVSPLFCESIEEWFGGNLQAKPYSGIRDELLKLVDETAQNGVPPEIMYERIKEGASKKVAQQKLLEAMRSDADNFLFILSIYKSDLPDILSSDKAKSDYLKRGGLILRSGLSRGVFGKVTGRRDIDALLAVAAVHTRSPLDEANVLALTKALSQSREKEERFSSLSALFLRGRSAGITQTEITAIVIRTFNQGGGFLQVENEISRRIK